MIVFFQDSLTPWPTWECGAFRFVDWNFVAGCAMWIFVHFPLMAHHKSIDGAKSRQPIPLRFNQLAAVDHAGVDGLWEKNNSAFISAFDRFLYLVIEARPDLCWKVGICYDWHWTRNGVTRSVAAIQTQISAGLQILCPSKFSLMQEMPK